MEASAVGARVRSARKKARLTQVELAKKARIEQSSLSKIERAECAPRASTITAIARACGVTTDELLLGKARAQRKAV